MVKTVGGSMQQLARSLGDEALRDGVSPQELKDFVKTSVDGLEPAQVQELFDAFETQLKPFGDDYFQSVFGVSKQALMGELGTVARSSSGSGNAGLQFHQAQGQAAPSEARGKVLRLVQRFLHSPLPGEGPDDLKAILKKDPSLGQAGDLQALTDRLFDFNAPPHAAVIDAFAATGQTGPAQATLDTVAQKLTEESLDPVGDVAGALREDSWVMAMLDSVGSDETSLSRFLMAPSRLELAQLVDNFMDPKGARQKADNALRMLNEIGSASGGFEIYIARDLPPADELTHDDAKFVIEHRVNDMRLEERDGRFTIAARFYGDDVTEAQVGKALDILSGSYDTELKGHKGDWYSANVLAGQGAPDPDAPAVDPGSVGSAGGVADVGLTGEDLFNAGIKLLNEKLADTPEFADVTDFSLTYAEMAPAIRVRTTFDRRPDDEVSDPIMEKMADMLEAAGMSGLVSRNYLPNNFIVTDKGGGHGL